jgi:hypothetical protein
MAQLARVVGGELERTAVPRTRVALGPQRVAIHSAMVEPGGVVVALMGRRDGHDWVTEAAANKAACGAGLAIPPRHALASAGVIRFPGHAMEMVRAGLALHGIAPSRHCVDLPLVPSMTLTSRLIDRRRLDVGDRIG